MLDRAFYQDVAAELMSLVNVKGVRTKFYPWTEQTDRTEFYLYDSENYFCLGTVEVTRKHVEFRQGGKSLIWSLADLDRPTFFEDTAEAICQQVR